MNTTPLSYKPQPTLPAELALAIYDNTAILFGLLITQILVPHQACPGLAEWIGAGFFCNPNRLRDYCFSTRWCSRAMLVASTRFLTPNFEYILAR